MFMNLPPRLGENNNKICKLRNLIYGLRQSSGACIECFGSTIKGHGYIHGNPDGNLEEEVFMNLQPRFREKLNNNKTCKLKNSIYGLIS